MTKRSLRFWHRVLYAAHRACIRYPIRTLVLFGLIFISSFAALPRLTMMMSIDDLVDRDFETSKQLHELKKNFLDQDEILVAIRNGEGRRPTKPELCSILNWIHGLAEERGDLNAIVSTLGIQWPTESTSHFRLSPLIDIDCTRSDLDETEKIVAGLDKVRSSPWGRTLTSTNGDDIAVLIYPKARVKATIHGTFNAHLVEELQAGFNEKVLKKNPSLSAHWIGDGIFQYHLHKGYETMPALNLLMSVLVILFFRLTLRTFISSTVFLTIITWTTIPLYAAMALVGHPIDVLSSSLSLMIFVAALEDFLFLANLMPRMSWKRAMTKIIEPAFYTSLTTVIGFGSLTMAPLDIVRRFGLWAAVGAALEWAILFLVLPAVLELFPRLGRWRLEPKAETVSKGIFRRPTPIFRFVAVGVFFIAVFVSGKLSITDSPERLLSVDHPARKDLRVIEQTRHWRGTVSLIFASHDAREANVKILEQVKKNPVIAFSEDPYSVDDFLTHDLSGPMRGFMIGLIEQNTLGHRLGPSQGQARAVLYLSDIDIVRVNELRREVSNVCGERCWLTGSLVSYGELSERVLSVLFESLAVSLVLVTAVIGVLCLARNPKIFVPLAIASMWGPAALLVIFFAFRIPVSYVTSMIASILVGLTGDNAIQFLFRSRPERSFLTTVIAMAPAACHVTLGMVICSSVFLFGYFDPMKTLGWVMMSGLFVSLVGDVWFLIEILHWRPWRSMLYTSAAPNSPYLEPTPSRASD